MRMFSFLTSDQLDNYFYIKPTNFTKYTQKNKLAYAIGATLYTPATREDLIEDLVNKKHAGLSSMVFCLEDAISDFEVPYAEKKIIKDLQYLQEILKSGLIKLEELPLLFLRVRSYDQLVRLVQMDREVFHLLTGVNLPKFSTEKDRPLLELIKKLNEDGILLYALPILETKEVIEIETRTSELVKIKELIDEYKDHCLNIRIGATDFCGLYGIRRNKNTTIYDIHLIRECIIHILNVFLRQEEPYIVSGAVFEYFIPKTVQEPISQSAYLDAFLLEISMDIANGIVGKTIIHPSQIKPVQALNAITYEEYMDAISIIESSKSANGVTRSPFANKMNETKPHYFWATKIISKAEIYGVLHESVTNVDLLYETKESIYTS